MILSDGCVKLRNGYGVKFYVAVFRKDGITRYSLVRFKSAAQAEAYGAALVERYERLKAACKEEMTA